MSTLVSSLRRAIETYAIVTDPVNGQIYAYEVDGYRSRTIMDDANIPSLLSAPFFGCLNASDTVYHNTRSMILSVGKPYFMRGPVINSVGGPHNGLGYAWPMASTVRVMTSNNDAEITAVLKQIVSSTNGLGLVHESISAFNESDWMRQRFSWANGLLGQMVLDLEARKPHLLAESYQ
jgi:uncharacterized protein